MEARTMSTYPQGRFPRENPPEPSDSTRTARPKGEWHTEGGKATCTNHWLSWAQARRQLAAIARQGQQRTAPESERKFLRRFAVAFPTQDFVALLDSMVSEALIVSFPQPHISLLGPFRPLSLSFLSAPLKLFQSEMT